MHEIIIGTKFKFMAHRKLFYAISGSLILITMISLILHGGPRKSVDFTGGNVLTVAFTPSASVDDVREAAEAADLEGAEVQMADQNTQAIIRFQTGTQDSSAIFDRFKAEMAGKQQEELQSIFKKMDPIIANIAQREGLTLVFEKQDSGLVYAPPSLDLTNELVRLYNDQYRGKGGGGKPQAAKEPKDAPKK